MPRRIKVKVGRTTTPAEPLPPSDFGVPGNRPEIVVRPGPTSTGLRVSTTSEMTGAQAMSTVLAAPVEADGRRYLRRARITGNIGMTSIGSNALVFEDCDIDVRGTNPIYALSAFYAAGSVEPTYWPEFRHCRIAGGTSSCLRGGWVRLLRCDLSYGVDILKPFQAMEAWGCWLHDNYRSPAAHCDSIQIVNGCSGALFQSNSFVGFTSADSPEEPNSWVSGVLQVGTITGPIGQPDPVRFIGNWVEGGRFGFRGSGGASDNPNNHPVSLYFRNNIFIRDSFQYGPTGNLHPTNDDLIPATYGKIPAPLF